MRESKTSESSGPPVVTLVTLATWARPAARCSAAVPERRHSGDRHGVRAGGQSAPPGPRPVLARGGATGRRRRAPLPARASRPGSARCATEGPVQGCRRAFDVGHMARSGRRGGGGGGGARPGRPRAAGAALCRNLQWGRAKPGAGLAALRPSAPRPSALRPSALRPSALRPLPLSPSALQPCALQPCALQPCAPQPLSPSALQPCALQPCALQPRALQPRALQPPLSLSQPTISSARLAGIDVIYLSLSLSAPRASGLLISLFASGLSHCLLVLARLRRELLSP